MWFLCHWILGIFFWDLLLGLVWCILLATYPNCTFFLTVEPRGLFRLVMYTVKNLHLPVLAVRGGHVPQFWLVWEVVVCDSWWGCWKEVVSFSQSLFLPFVPADTRSHPVTMRVARSHNHFGFLVCVFVCLRQPWTVCFWRSCYMKRCISYWFLAVLTGFCFCVLKILFAEHNKHM